MKRVKRTKGKGVEIIEDERRKANKLSKDQNERKGRIGQPTKKQGMNKIEEDGAVNNEISGCHKKCKTGQ